MGDSSLTYCLQCALHHTDSISSLLLLTSVFSPAVTCRGGGAHVLTATCPDTEQNLYSLLHGVSDPVWVQGSRIRQIFLIRSVIVQVIAVKAHPRRRWTCLSAMAGWAAPLELERASGGVLVTECAFLFCQWQLLHPVTGKLLPSFKFFSSFFISLSWNFKTLRYVPEWCIQEESSGNFCSLNTDISDLQKQPHTYTCTQTNTKITN